jgi:hypothetical protein
VHEVNVDSGEQTERGDPQRQSASPGCREFTNSQCSGHDESWQHNDQKAIVEHRDDGEMEGGPAPHHRSQSGGPKAQTTPPAPQQETKQDSQR